LSLVGWRLSDFSLEPPNGLREIQQRLRRIHQDLHFEQMEIALWLPGQSKLERLKFQLECLPRCAYSEIRRLLSDNSFDALSQNLEPARPPVLATSFLEAESYYRKISDAYAHRRCSAEELQAAREQYEHWLDADVVQPLSRLGNSPRIRSLRAVAVPLIRATHRAAFALDKDFAQAPPRALAHASDQVRDLSKLVGNVVTVLREMRP
jgi:hypothetical protein